MTFFQLIPPANFPDAFAELETLDPASLEDVMKANPARLEAVRTRLRTLHSGPAEEFAVAS